MNNTFPGTVKSGNQKVKSWLSVFLLFVALTVSLGSVACSDNNDENAPQKQVKFVQWSDIHLGDQENTSEADWEKALTEGIASNPDFFVLTGDMCDNKKTDAQGFADRTQYFIDTYIPRLRSQNKPILFAYGNNDFFPNYSTDPKDMAPTFDAYRKAFGSDYYLDDLGNGVYKKPLGGMTWITINSVAFTSSDEYDPTLLKAQRKQILSWLRGELNKIPQGQTAVILSHVAPSYDNYDHQIAFDKDSMKEFAEIADKANRPIVVLSGHYHRNEMHAIALNDDNIVPVIPAGGISKKYGHYANWRKYNWALDEDGTPETISFDINYVNYPQYNSNYSIDIPFYYLSWVDFRSDLGFGDEFYMGYMSDFDEHAEGWEARAQTDECLQSIYDEVIIYLEDLI